MPPLPRPNGTLSAAKPWGHPWSHAHKGSFLPLPQHGRIWPKHSVSFCAHWPRSSLARCQRPGRSVSPPGAPPGAGALSQTLEVCAGPRG